MCDHPSIIKLKINKCLKLLNEFNNLELKKNASTKNFEEFQKIIVNKILIQKVNEFIISLNSYKNGLTIKPKILITSYIIHFYPKYILGDSEYYQDVDYEIIDASAKLINSFDTNNINLIWNHMREFDIYFSDWIKIDKDRTIENLIISYYHRSKHIEHIKNNNNDSYQQMDMISEIEKQRYNILKTISIIDMKIDIEYIKQNYESIFTNFVIMRNQIKKSLIDNMKRAYYNMLYNDISHGEMLSSYNEIKTIGNRLIDICPQNKVNSFKQKFNDELILNMLSDNSFTNEFIKFIVMIIDYIAIMDAPLNDMNNKEWKIHICNLMNENNYNENLPRILIEIEDRIDNLYQQIINIL
jgi:hypothetical protein